jgi:hypothetical protein
MELLFVAVIAVGIGVVAFAAAPHRDRMGVALMPAFAMALAAVIWVALTWAGMPWDGGWIWVATLVGTGVVTILAALRVGRDRQRSDARLFSSLAGERA